MALAGSTCTNKFWGRDRVLDGFLNFETGPNLLRECDSKSEGLIDSKGLRLGIGPNWVQRSTWY